MPQTIQSIKALTYKHIEWFVIDGNSTDQTIELIKENQELIDYWVIEPDGGICEACNKGVAKASGEWIEFLGAGDEYAQDSIASDYTSQFKNPFLKIDTQGYEWAILDGALNTLPYIRSVLLELSLVPLYEGQYFIARSIGKTRDCWLYSMGDATRVY